MDSLFAQMPLVISYYTKNTPYEEEIKGLLSSCARFGIECHVEGVEDLGSWEANCGIKPYFIRDQLRKWQRPLLWVDADAVFMQPLTFEEFMFADLGILKYVEEDDPRFCVGAGTVYVNATFGGEKGMDLWCFYADQIFAEQEKVPPFADQFSLYLTLKANPPLTIAQLPLRYCTIFDHTEDIKKEDIVIEQRQASRRWR